MNNLQPKSLEYSTKQQSVTRIVKWLLYAIPALLGYFFVFWLIKELDTMLIVIGGAVFLIALTIKVILEFINYNRFHEDNSSESISSVLSVVGTSKPALGDEKQGQGVEGNIQQCLDFLVEQSNKSLFKKDFQAIGSATNTLAGIGAASVEAIVVLLRQTNNLELQLNLVNTLGRIDDARAIEVLREKAQNENKYDQVAIAARGLLKKHNRA